MCLSLEYRIQGSCTGCMLQCLHSYNTCTQRILKTKMADLHFFCLIRLLAFDYSVTRKIYFHLHVRLIEYNSLLFIDPDYIVLLIVLIRFFTFRMFMTLKPFSVINVNLLQTPKISLEST